MSVWRVWGVGFVALVGLSGAMGFAACDAEGEGGDTGDVGAEVLNPDGGGWDTVVGADTDADAGDGAGVDAGDGAGVDAGDGAGVDTEVFADADVETADGAGVDTEVFADADVETADTESEIHDSDDSDDMLDVQDTWISSDVEIGPDAADTNDTSDTIDTNDTVDALVEAGPSLIEYEIEEPRRLYFLNNPEQILTTELGDSDLMDTTLLRVTASGKSRSFFEHVNKSGRTIGFGVQVFNPGPGTVTVTVEGVGYTVGIQGGAPFAQALSGEGASAASALAAGQSRWLLRKDDTVSNGTFFSGVVDFTVAGGSVIVNHIAYDRFDRLDGSTAERDYVTRIEPDGTSEARMYKGVASASEARLELEVDIDGSTAAGALPVRTRRYDLGAMSFGEPMIESQWVSHIGPSQNAASSLTDMVSFVFRAWDFDPIVRSDAEDKYPNLGNWGVIYRTRVVIHNAGSQARTVRWRMLASPGAGAGLAKRSGVGSSASDARGTWTSHQLAAGGAIDLSSVVVPANGSATLEGAMVLGGPSGGALRQSLVID